MKQPEQITVLAAATQEALERGADVEFTFDTIADAKRKAKYYLTEEYRISSESSTRLGYAQVRVNGECRYDYFGEMTCNIQTTLN